MYKLLLYFKFCHVRMKYGDICSRKDFLNIPENPIQFAKATHEYNLKTGRSEKIPVLVEVYNKNRPRTAII